MLSRRGFLVGLVAGITAPAIVHAGNLMPVKALQIDGLDGLEFDGVPLTLDGGYPGLVAITRKAFLPRLHALWKPMPVQP